LAVAREPLNEEDFRPPPVAFASKEGIVLASMALYGIFYFILSPYGFAEKLKDENLFQYYTIFFMAAFIILIFTAVIMILQRPSLIKNEYLGMTFFFIGGISLFIVPYSGAADIELPFPDTLLFGVGGAFYVIGIVLFLRYGGYFAAWMVGSGLTVAMAGHEAVKMIFYTGHFGRYDQQLWGIGATTLTISMVLFIIQQVKLRYVLVPMIEKGNTARRRKRYDEALQYFDRALGYYPHFTTALNNKGNVLFNMGKYRESRECYEKALEIDPYYANAKRNLAVLRRRA
jgi:tetratricopeptide (TPR) repeat protein